ncbi:Fc.00g010500.m01.CDS01 [Cosmosporella sp. VM-42]
MVADRAQDVWDLNDEGEVNSIWRYSGHRVSDSLEEQFLAFKQKVEGAGSLQQHQGSPSSVDENTGRVQDQNSPVDLEELCQWTSKTGTFNLHPANRPAPIVSMPDLSQRALTKYCTIWLDQYHSWFPILHQTTLLKPFHNSSDQASNSTPIILKAIAVVIIPSQQPPNCVPPEQQLKWTLSLRDEVILEAFHHISLQALQALLVLTVSEYGAGRLEDFYNLIALCKRMSTQLGLRDLVTLNCSNYRIPSIVPPRMLTVPSTAVEREEKIRAFWATDALDTVSTVGVAWHVSISRPEPRASVPCDDEIWRFPEAVIATYQFGNLEAPSSFSLFVRLATNELWHVHNFLQQNYDSTSIEALQGRQGDCDTVYERLVAWHRDFEQMLTVSTPVYADLFDSGGETSQHPNSILIHCTIHNAVISLYQRLIFPVNGTTADDASWIRAADRCLSSCDQMATILRGVSDEMLETTNPQIIYCIFIAARFYMIYSHAMASSMPNKLRLLVHALCVCGQRWPLARQLHRVLEAATAECVGTSVTQNPLPSEFYDLQYFSLDIYEALRAWVVKMDDS